MNVRPSTWREVRSAVLQATKDPTQRERWLAALTTTIGRSTNWQQDFYQSYVDSQGRPQARELAHYRARPSAVTSYRNLSEALQRACGVQSGDPIFPENPTDYANGMAGGNIEAGPNGICFLGDDKLTEQQRSSYGRRVCGGGEHVEAPTSWLSVGHTDEMLATVRTGPGECDMAIMLASPKMGLDAMRADPSGPALAALIDSRNGEEMAQKSFVYDVCRAYLESVPQPTPAPASPTPAIKEGGSYFNLFVPRVFAQIVVSGASQNMPFGAESIRRCRDMTNGQFITALNSHPELMQVNDKIERHMVAFRQRAEAAWQRLAPKCNPRIVEMPMIVAGRLEGTDADSRVRRGESIFPNVANLQQFGRTLIIPDPHNPATRKAIEEKVKALGLQVDFINTNFAHKAKGNLHCSTNVLRYCRPRN